MKTVEHIAKTKWQITKRQFFSKKFQGIVFSIDCDVPQGFEYKTICVVTLKFLFVGFWIAFDKKVFYVARLSKYKSGGLLPGSGFKKSIK